MVTLVGILAVVFSVIFISGSLSAYGAQPGNKTNTTSSTGTNMLNEISKMSNDMSKSQAVQLSQFSDKIRAYMQLVQLESNGNLTKMNELILNDLVIKGLFNEKEKQTILHILKGIVQNASVEHGPAIKKEISSALGEAMRNNPNLNMVIVTGLLNNSISKLQPSTGPNGLPVLTLNDVKIHIPASVALVTGCAMLGLALGGGMGAALGAALC
jgi:hypothetical protein